MLLEVNLEAMAEGLPAHEEDNLLHHAGSLAIGYTVDQGFRHISASAVSLDFMVGRHKVFLQSPSLVASEMDPRFWLELIYRRTSLSTGVV